MAEYPPISTCQSWRPLRVMVFVPLLVSTTSVSFATPWV